MESVVLEGQKKYFLVIVKISRPITFSNYKKNLPPTPTRTLGVLPSISISVIMCFWQLSKLPKQHTDQKSKRSFHCIVIADFFSPFDS